MIIFLYGRTVHILTIIVKQKSYSKLKKCDLYANLNKFT